MSTLNRYVASWLPVLALALASCGSEDTRGDESGGASAVASGATGGVSATGGLGGTGGVAGSGGTAGAGGGGGSGGGGSGGVTATGGVDATGGVALTGGVSPTGGVTPTTGGLDPGTGGVEPGTGGVDPGASGGDPGTGGADAGAGGVAPSTGGVDPGTGGADAGAGGVAPGPGGADPGTGGTGAQPTECPFTQTATPSGPDWVDGDLITFNNSGGWCWYQDERAIVDVENGRLVIGSVQNSRVNVVHWDLAARSGSTFTVDSALPYTDDHDAPAIVKTKDGGYAAMWAGHRNDCYSRYSRFDGSAWSSKANFDWSPHGCVQDGDGMVTYANAWYLGDTLYSYVRSVDTSPNYLYSEDHGRTWRFGGRLTSTPRVGYVAGYYKYWGNNEDRIDWLGTEAHPRDNDNSLYHGYVQNGQIHDSTGRVIDSDFTDANANQITEYTRVFAAGSSVGGVALNHAWNADLVRYDDGTVAAIWTARVVGTSADDPDKRLMYARFDGDSWKLTYLARAGTKLYDSEQDYTGLGALDPNNPEVIYISTPYDPRTDEGTFTGKKEIWKGVTCDGGTSFDWVPVTANSSMDNLRPIVPQWDATHRALLWMRGTYTSAQSFNTAIVGLLEGP